MHKSVFLLIFIFFNILNAFSHRLSGVITDQNNEPIPYATIYINNTTKAVSSNIKGEYYMELDNGTYEIVFYNLGFEKKTIQVVINNKNEILNVQLTASTTTLSAIEITAEKEDPAYAIIRKAIKEKNKYTYISEEYTCNAYLKSSLEKEFIKKGGIDSVTKKEIENKLTKEKMNFLESYSTVYYRKPNQIKEIKEAYRDLSESENGSSVEFGVNHDPDGAKVARKVNIHLFKTKISEAEFNFYENLVLVPKLSQSPIISPLHYATFLSYKFKLEEYFYEDGLWINKIAVTPKRTDASLVSGHIYITDSLWNIKAVDFTIDPGVLNYFNYFKINQNYSLIENKSWVLTHEEFVHDSKEGKETILGHTLIKYSNYNLNPQIRKNFFNNELSVIEDSAYTKDSVYWLTKRPITLKDEEYKFINRIDSIDNYHASAEYLKKQDSIENKFHFYELLFGMQFQNSFKKQSFYMGGLINGIFSSLTPFGNIRLAQDFGYKKEFKKGYEINPSAFIKYGYTNKDLRGYGALSYTYLPKKFGRLHIKYENDYGVINQYQAIGTAISMVNYVNDIGYSAGHEIEIFNGAFLDVKADYTQKRPLHLEYDDWFKNLAKSEEAKSAIEEFKGINFDAFNRFTLDITLKYTPFQKYYTEPYKKIIVGSNYPTLAINYRKGIAGILKSQVNYDFIEFRLWDDIRFGSFGQSRWKVYAGKFINSAELQFTEKKFFRMSDSWYFSNPIRSFQLLDTSLSTFNEYFEAHYIHDFEGKLLNKIPLIKRLHLTETAGGGILYINENNFQHAEIFVGLEKPFNIRKWKQRFKIGCYYVISDSNYSKVSNLIKFGISIWDPFANQWVY